MVIPKALPKGGTIGLIAPASPQRDEARLERGVRYLERCGYRVVPGANLHRRHAGYLAGTDDERLADLHAMFANPAIDAIMCARGGYGTPRLLASVRWSVIRRHPKIFVGFSDTTALQLAIWRRCGLVTFSGALPSVDMADGFDPRSEEQFWRILTSRRPMGVLPASPAAIPVRYGSAGGPLLGGNLSLMSTLLGTPWSPSYKGALVVTEDVGEEPYRVDRLLTHLRLAGVWKHAAGVAFGAFTPSPLRTSTTPDRPMEEVLAEQAPFVEGPVLRGLPYGHETYKYTLPIGLPASMQVTKDKASLRLPVAAVV